MTTIDETLNMLPPQARQEVVDFVEFISQKYLKKKTKTKKSRTMQSKKEVLNFAGSWEDMDERDFQSLVGDICERRRDSFSGRREI